MNTFLLDKARLLRIQGYDHGSIRKYLSNSGISNNEIKSILRKLDTDEIHELHLKQKVQKSRTQLMVALVIFLVGLIFNIHQYSLQGNFDIMTLFIPIALLIAAYIRYKAIKNKRYTTAQILRDNSKARR